LSHTASETILGKMIIKVYILDDPYDIEVQVLEKLSHELVLGNVFFNKYDVRLDYGTRQLRVFRTLDPQVSLVRLNQITTIPPLSEKLVGVTSELFVDELCVFHSFNRLVAQSGVACAKGVGKLTNGSCTVILANLTNKYVTLQAASIVSKAMKLNSNEWIEHSADNVDSYCEETGQKVLTNLHENHSELIKSYNLLHENHSDFIKSFIVDGEGVNHEQHIKFQNLLMEFIDCFAYDALQSSVATNVYHKIDTGNSNPINSQPYRVSPAERKNIQEQIADMLSKGVISTSKSPWASPVVLVSKKDGSMRFCVDYRKLNSVTVKDVYPIPRIDDSLAALSGAQYFSAVDIFSGYWQIPMHPESRHKTAFTTETGLFQFNVMPFGLCNAPATFQRFMDAVMSGLKWNCLLVYIDDIIIFSNP
jgi:hypothetical protein